MVNPDDGESGALGGTCANVGCVPSKALLAASLAYAKARKGSSAFGLKPVIPVMDFDQMQRHRAKAVKDSNRGVAMLFKKAGVEFVPEKVGFRTKAQTGWELKTAGGQILLAHADILRRLAETNMEQTAIFCLVLHNRLNWQGF